MTEALLTYLLEATVCLSGCIIFYKLLLQRLTFFAGNRFFLMGSAVAGLAIPAMRIPVFVPYPEAAIRTFVPIIRHWPLPLAQPVQPAGTPTWAVSPVDMLLGVYLAVALILLVRLLLDVLAAYQLIRRYPVVTHREFRLVKVPDALSPSSFFRYVFLPGQMNADEIRHVVAHELVHVRQWHSLDRLFIRLLGVVFWFNPLMRWWRQCVEINHEYQADAQAARISSPSVYSRLLLKLAANDANISLMHNFSHVSLKQRIRMVHQMQSSARQRVRFLFSLPLVALMVLFLACEEGQVHVPPDQPLPPHAGRENSQLIGTWKNLNMTLINERGGKINRDFSGNTGKLLTCFSELTLNADGRFQMHDEQTAKSVSGTWNSDQFGIAVRLSYVDALSKENTMDPLKRSLYLMDGTLYTGLLETIIHMDVTSLKNGKLEAWQYLPPEGDLPGGIVYYEYIKQ